LGTAGFEYPACLQIRAWTEAAMRVYPHDAPQECRNFVLNFTGVVFRQG